MSASLDQNIARATAHLARFRERPVVHLIDGTPDPGDGRTFETLSPVDNAVLATVARGGAAEIDRAARAARRAFPGWSGMPGADR